MTNKMKLKMTIDVAMSIVLFVLMSYQLTGQKNHEIAGALMLILFIAHHVLNFGWFKALGKGSYSSYRICTTVMNVALFLIMFLLMISGIRMSGYVFTFIEIPISMSVARSLHMTCSYLSFLLMGIHMGFHCTMMAGMIKKMKKGKVLNAKVKIVLRIIIGIVDLYGVYALIKRNFFSYISLQIHFVFFDYMEPGIYYVLDLLSISVLVITIGYYVQKLMTSQSKHGG
ncbi:MAG: DUF4405 domain-containing protein [Anaerostipes sp.]|nr:DUF4405 domain-containing protein [Anaerostipes sp.]